jgi:asparagine N-glycosylation enzyme membrane subunit Stt3
MRRAPPIRRILAVVILACAVLFAIGSAIERNQSGEKGGEAVHAAAQPRTESGGRGGAETGEGSEAGHTEGGGAEAPSGGETHNESSEDIFGINPEAKGLVAVAVAAGVILAAAVWFWSATVVLFAAIAFGLVFAAFDIREVTHQVNESRGGLVVIAAVLALMHLSVAALAGIAISGGRSSGPQLR